MNKTLIEMVNTYCDFKPPFLKDAIKKFLLNQRAWIIDKDSKEKMYVKQFIDWLITQYLAESTILPTKPVNCLDTTVRHKIKLEMDFIDVILYFEVTFDAHYSNGKVEVVNESYFVQRDDKELE